ncbi:MAG: D-alanyl-D-alanine carboxypeptidase family protein, partial [Rhodoferax sp.]
FLAAFAAFSLAFLPAGPLAHAADIAPPAIAATAYVLVDVTSGQTLASQQGDERRDPASLTKLMTAYLVFDALRTKKITLTKTFPVSVRAWKMPGSRMFIDPKMQVPVEDLIKGLIVQSGNDAAMALAEGVGGTEEHFVQMMNDEAKALGMNSTTYKNPDGLPEPGHVTTARDLATLVVRLRRDFPEYAYFDSIKKYYYPGTPPSNATNRNGMLFRDPTVDGMKTGYTKEAGYCLIATAKREFPNVGSRRMLTIVLGTSSEHARVNESQKLLNWGYTAYDDIKLFDADQPVVTPSVWKGKESVLKLGRPQAIVVAVPAGTASKIKTQVARPDPLVALDAVPQAGGLGRAWDALRLWIK